MKKSFLLFFTILSLGLFGQSTISQHRTYVPFLFGIGHNYEHSISDSWTFNYFIELKYQFGDKDINGEVGGKDHNVFLPTIGFQPRYYYNIKKRAIRGKNIAHNNAEYFAVNTIVDFPPIWKKSEGWPSPSNVFRLAPSWGIRRTYFSHMDVDLNIYAGVSNFDTFVYGFLFSIGYVF